MDVIVIKDKLRKGDKTLISEMTGSSFSLVDRVLEGARSHKTTKGRIIVLAALRIIDDRELAMEEFEVYRDK